MTLKELQERLQKLEQQVGPDAEVNFLFALQKLEIMAVAGLSPLCKDRSGTVQVYLTKTK